MSSHQVIVSLCGKVLTHTLAASLPPTHLPFLHEVVDPPFAFIVADNRKMAELVNEVLRAHVCDGDGPVFGTCDQVPTGVRRDHLGSLLAR